jgi:homocysteine S-methyltransferase
VTANETLARALAAGPIVLDGGLATTLEAAGHDITSALWSARLLIETPDAVRAAHVAFFAAGARVATTATYQASFEGLAAAGVDRDGAVTLLFRAVALARQAQEAAGEASTWIAASIGPYGAMLAGGEEYTGAYVDPDWPGGGGGGLSVADLRAFHAPRMAVLADAGADVLACETLPCLAEVEAVVAEIERLDVPAWVSLTTVTGPDGRVRTRRGEDAAEAFALAGAARSVLAVGVNCMDPAGAAVAVRAAGAASGKPVVVYPNSGETWDAGRRAWAGAAGFRDAGVIGWTRAGARLIGGCCRVGPEGIAEIAGDLAG